MDAMVIPGLDPGTWHDDKRSVRLSLEPAEGAKPYAITLPQGGGQTGGAGPGGGGAAGSESAAHPTPALQAYSPLQGEGGCYKLIRSETDPLLRNARPDRVAMAE
jgi:hypothetical protein